ncbi:hypothetical protein TKK_0018832 [Trichogramma kaykai]
MSLRGAARAAALSVLEECIDALAVYRRSLKSRPALVVVQQQQQQRRAANTAANVDGRPGRSALRAMDEEAAFDAAYVEMIFDKLVRDR